jgi:SAM-dependent methyltransferase
MTSLVRSISTAVGRSPPHEPLIHREDQYESALFETLNAMQTRHFWYLGRHRFLLRALQGALRHRHPAAESICGIDLGGGCGGWLRYLHRHVPALFQELALADSSQEALSFAASVVPPGVSLHQIDLLQNPWTDRWDVAFLLDVLEHIPEDAAALRGIGTSLKPGGLVFVTTPALERFRTGNDELVHHVRRYSRTDFQQLAQDCGLDLVTSRYFMFFLSPLLVLSRWLAPARAGMSRRKIQDYVNRTHRVPAAPVNQALRLVFSMETPLGLWLPFPWGTSLLGVFRKPRHLDRQ